MGFLLAGNGLLVVFLTIMAYKKVSPADFCHFLPFIFQGCSVFAATQYLP